MSDIKPIDCDVHPSVTDIRQLLPYLEEYWRDSVEERGIGSLEFSSYPPNAPITARPDFRGAERLCGGERARARRAGVRPLGRRQRDPQLPLRRAARLQRGHGARLPSRAERLDRERMARPRSAAARLDHRADAERRIRGGRDRALRQRQTLRAGDGAGDAGDAARAAPSLADLRRRRTARAADRHPRRVELPQPGHVIGLAVALRRGLHQPGAGLSVAGHQPDHRGRVRQIPEAQGRAARVRRDLAAGVPVALLEILARRAHRDPLGRPLAGRNRARQFPPDHPAVRRAVRSGRCGTHHRSFKIRRYAVVFVRFSALAVRRRRTHAERHSGRIAAQDTGREPARDV